jgi:hypothetical protein
MHTADVSLTDKSSQAEAVLHSGTPATRQPCLRVLQVRLCRPVPFRGCKPSALNWELGTVSLLKAIGMADMERRIGWLLSPGLTYALF